MSKSPEARRNGCPSNQLAADVRVRSFVQAGKVVVAALMRIGPLAREQMGRRGGVSAWARSRSGC